MADPCMNMPNGWKETEEGLLLVVKQGLTHIAPVGHIENQLGFGTLAEDFKCPPWGVKAAGTVGFVKHFDSRIE